MTDTGRDVLNSMFSGPRRRGRAALLPYLTAGIPTVDDSVRIFKAMAEAGADGFEVGIPYADPLMDGPVIMAAGEEALRGGVTVSVALDLVRRVVDETGKPVLVMTYVNPVLRRGIDTFFSDVVTSGASGVIIADLPVDEAGPFLETADAVGLGLALFVAPTTDDIRLRAVIDANPAFIYAVAEIGVTGERTSASSNISKIAERIRELSDVPIVFGVGISTPSQAREASRHGDGVIVGTAVVRRVIESESAEMALREVSSFISGVSKEMSA